MVPVMRETPMTTVAQMYWGPEGNQVCTLNTTTANANPYFVSTASLEAGVWYLAVGYVYPAGSTGQTNTDAGIYRLDTGVKFTGGNNYCWAAATTGCGHRAYQYYADPGAVMYFDAPMVHVVDGNEPPIRSLLPDSSQVSTTNPITAANANSFLGDKSIPGVKIGTLLASDNFNGTVDANGEIITNGTDGWAISKGSAGGAGGKAVFNNVRVRGDVQATSLNGVNIVDTYNIINNAVTGGVYGSMAGALPGENVWKVALSLNVNVGIEDSDIITGTNGSQSFPGGSKSWGFVLYIDGTEISRTGGTVAGDSISLSGGKRVGPGIRNVQVHWYGQPGVDLMACNLWILIAKK
jgi:hypothetical protein